MKYSGKKFLLIAGGGTLGTYVSNELLRLGGAVDVICPEKKRSNDPNLRFHQALVSRELLDRLFDETHYDGIVSFIHYKDPEAYKEVYSHLCAHTGHVIFLSSYRVYAGSNDPLTEESPRLYDVLSDPDFLENENYAVPKSIVEDYLRNERKGEPWTIVRPVISFSARRLDLVLYSKTEILTAAENREPLILPETLKNYNAGLDWAGNSGKLIANLFLEPKAFGETFTVYSGHNATWGDVARVYEDLTGVEIRWVSEKEYERTLPLDTNLNVRNMWLHDRIYNRKIDPSKVLSVTGLTRADFKSIRDGIRAELDVLGWKRT